MLTVYGGTLGSKPVVTRLTRMFSDGRQETCRDLKNPEGPELTPNGLQHDRQVVKMVTKVAKNDANLALLPRDFAKFPLNYQYNRTFDPPSPAKSDFGAPSWILQRVRYLAVVRLWDPWDPAIPGVVGFGQVSNSDNPPQTKKKVLFHQKKTFLETMSATHAHVCQSEVKE
ncbi:hypothetical protein TNCV_4696431 [Trichonephila clavipes]|nr:hypothetical protein TNCV_4696431 [Trichonephila clavipes]